MLKVVTIAIVVCSSATSAIAATDYHVTDAEKAACTSDAVRFCFNTYPDQNKLFGCMRQNRDSLSAVCRVAFDAGVKRRHL